MEKKPPPKGEPPASNWKWPWELAFSGEPEDALVDARELSSVRNNWLSRIVPSWFVPASLSNGMLLLGSNKQTGKDCAFPLPEYLVYGGAISLSLVVASVVGRHILGWILDDKIVTRGERRLLKALEFFSYFMVVVEVGAVLAGAFFVYPYLTTWQYSDTGGKNYCEMSMVLFTTIFSTLGWVIALFAAACWLYVQFVSNVQVRKGKKKFTLSFCNNCGVAQYIFIKAVARLYCDTFPSFMQSERCGQSTPKPFRRPPPARRKRSARPRPPASAHRWGP
jgi:hypothetical protein